MFPLLRTILLILCTQMQFSKSGAFPEFDMWAKNFESTHWIHVIVPDSLDTQVFQSVTVPLSIISTNRFPYYSPLMKRRKKLQKLYCVLLPNETESSTIAENFFTKVKGAHEENPVNFFIIVNHSLDTLMKKEHMKFLNRTLKTYGIQFAQLFVTLIYFLVKQIANNEFIFTQPAIYMCTNCFNRYHPPGSIVNTWEIHFNIQILNNLTTSIHNARVLGSNGENGVIWNSYYNSRDMDVELASLAAMIEMGAKSKRTVSPFVSHVTGLEMDAVVLSLLLNFSQNQFQNLAGNFPHMQLCETKSFEQFRCIIDGPQISKNLVFSVNPKHNHKKYFILGETKSYNFITCDGVHENMSHTFLLSPFRPVVWFCLIFSLSIFSTFLYLWHRSAVKSSSRKFSSIVDVCWDSFSVFMEQAAHIVHNYKSRKHSGIYTVSCALLIFLLMLITSSYKGEITSRLLQPIKFDTKYKFFEDFENFSIFSSTNERFLTTVYEPKKNYKSTPWVDELFSVAFSYRWYEIWSSSPGGNAKSKKFESNVLPHFVKFENPKRGFDFISNCHKTAYALENSKIENALIVANYLAASEAKNQSTTTALLQGAAQLSPTFEFWLLSPHFDWLLARKLLLVVQSGIYSLWEKWIAIGKLQKIEALTKNKRMRAQRTRERSNSKYLISSVFMIGKILVPIAVIVFS